MEFDSIKDDVDNSLTLSLKNYAYEILDQCKQVYGPHIQISELSWVINTQKTLNIYLRTFKDRFGFAISSHKDIKQLGNLQYQIITDLEKSIPKNAKITQEYFYPQLIKSFAKHNKKLADSWIG
ncbi:MAG: hypothetical protein HeimC3_29140 [Candidatus Heimdallarchaeota archaeon LC_3]|nr:MAG: hypothetical protein HeimC3_29140 [Candidatus Heimdallarchaeota archaeon LC_3]